MSALLVPNDLTSAKRSVRVVGLNKGPRATWRVIYGFPFPTTIKQSLATHAHVDNSFLPLDAVFSQQHVENNAF